MGTKKPLARAGREVALARVRRVDRPDGGGEATTLSLASLAGLDLKVCVTHIRLFRREEYRAVLHEAASSKTPFQPGTASHEL